MPVVARFSGATSPTAIVGAAFYWAWVDTAFFTTVLYAPFPSASSYFPIAFLIATSVNCVALLVAAYAPVHVGSLLKRPVVLAGIGCLGVAGSLLDIAGQYQQSPAMVVLGSILCGVVFGLGFIVWGQVCAVGGARTTSIHIPGAFACGVGIDLLIMMMMPPYAALVTAVLPLVSFGFLIALYQQVPDRLHDARTSRSAARLEACVRARGQGVKTEATGVASLKRHSGRQGTWFGLTWNVILAVSIFGLAFGFMEQMNVFAFGGAAVANPRLFLAARGLTAVIVFLGIAFLGWRPYAAYRAGLLVMVAGFLVMPFASSIAGWSTAAGAIVMAGYTCFDIMIWTFLCEIAFFSQAYSESTIGIGRALTHIGIVSGVLIGAWVGSARLDPVPLAVTTTSIGYLTVIAVVLVLDDGSGLWSLLKYGTTHVAAPSVDSERPSLQNATAEVANAHGLTSREREIFDLLAIGRSAPHIAEQLCISENTVNSHVRHIYGKLGVHGRQELLDVVRARVDQVDAGEG